jgi:hypothetical protein
MCFSKLLLGLLSLLVCLDVGATSVGDFAPVACPEAVLDDIPNASCAVRTNFSFLIFGSIQAVTPSMACVIASAQLTQSASTPTSCEFSSPLRSCVCTEQGGFQTTWPVTEDSASLLPMCPADFTGMPQIRVPVKGADGFPSALGVCVGNVRNVPLPDGETPPPVVAPAPCTVPPLHAMSDPDSLQHERGKYVGSSDLEHLGATAKNGQACMLARVDKAVVFPVAGHLPGEYQQHLKEVWDTWHALRNDTNAACKATRDAARLEWLKHKLVRDPPMSQTHAAGNAVDITGLAAASADASAAICGMSRPDVKASPQHFQPGK